jgi:hypothetical protein
VTTPPAELPVTKDELKAQLKINPLIILEDDLLDIYISAATTFAEKYTRRDIIQRTYSTFREFFPQDDETQGYYYGGFQGRNSSGTGNVGFELRKSPLVSVESITYFDTNNVPTVVDDTTYYNTIQTDYSMLLTLDPNVWPSDASSRQQCIDISFICGLFPDAASVEGCWKVAILEHCVMLYSNRGDCGDANCAALLPAASKAFYEQKRILNL